jgi:hypothetical protein
MIFARGGWLFLSSASDYFSLPLSVRFVKFCRETKLIGAVGQDTELQSMLVGSSHSSPGPGPGISPRHLTPPRIALEGRFIALIIVHLLLLLLLLLLIIAE